MLERMKSIKNFLISSKLFIILVVFFLILCFVGNYRFKEISYDKRDLIVSMGRAENIEYAKFFVVENEADIDDVIGVVVFDNIAYETKEYCLIDILLQPEKNYREEVSYFIDINTGKVVDSIKHTKLQKKWDEKLCLSRSSYAYIDGKNICLETYVSKNLFNHKYKSGYKIYNVKDKNIEEYDEVDYYDKKFYKKAYFQWISDVKMTPNRDRAEQYYLLINETYYYANDLKYDMYNTLWCKAIYCETMGVPLVFKISDLPQNNGDLYEEFPYLLKAKNDSSMQDYYVILIFPYSMNADEVVKMITEEGHEVSYEGVFVPEEYSIDGQKHYVDSFEEYMQYLKIEE